MATKKARVLSTVKFEGKEYRPNDVIELEADQIKSLEESGSVDSNKAAVDYATKLAAKPEAVAK
jgi:hypothetical protein